jgi:hypothetical protein
MNYKHKRIYSLSVAKNEMLGLRKLALRNLRNEALSSEYFELFETAEQCIG